MIRSDYDSITIGRSFLGSTIAMTIELQCFANCDDVFLAWRSTEGNGKITGCLGFAIEIKDSSGNIEALNNLKGFEADHPAVGQTEPTTTWPLQTYTWTDHSILVDSSVSFRVTAMMGQPKALTRGIASNWSPVIELSVKTGANTCTFFNRGVILSQFVARYAQQNNLKTVAQLKSNLSNDVSGPLMQFLSGELGKAIRGILQEAKNDNTIELYCALFELDLPDLVDGLLAIGKRAHVLLANGSAPNGGDENSAAAAQLQGKVDLHRRMVPKGHLAHNKFVAIVKNGQPYGVWTGSTNWTLTGLHTQINNGLAVANTALAQAYRTHWNTLVAAGNGFPAALINDDGAPLGPFSLESSDDTALWFTPMKAATEPDGSNVGGADIEELMAIVGNAKQGVLFIMFMPGQEPLLSILKQAQKGLYVRGVASTLPAPGKNQSNQPATFQLMHGADFKQYSMDVVQPQGVGAVGDFLATFTRQQFLSGMGYAITHSKVIVVDPFGANPVVVTGSHNLSKSASENNDENLLIIRNCPSLARAYAVNCMSVYQHYRWPASQQDHANAPAKSGAGYLATDDSWQTRLQDPDTVADLKFWCGS